MMDGANRAVVGVLSGINASSSSRRSATAAFYVNLTAPAAIAKRSRWTTDVRTTILARSWGGRIESEAQVRVEKPFEATSFRKIVSERLVAVHDEKEGST